MVRLDGSTLAAVSLVLVVVVAGCGAGPTATETSSEPTAGASTTAPGSASDRTPSATPTPTTSPDGTATPTAEPTVPVERGSLPVDADRVWTRVTDMTGADVEPPSVHVYPISALDERTAARQQLRFLAELGLTPPDDPVAELNRSLGALTYETGRVNVYVGEDVSDSAVECVLAHEFAHVVQFRRGVPERTLRNLTDDGGSVEADGIQVYRALLEGSAMSVQRAYAAEYGCTGASPYRSWVASGEPWKHQTAAPYYYGERYVNATEGAAASLAALADDPPTTTEQVLHPGRDDEPAPLSVTVTDETGDWTEDARLRLGELLVRSSLLAGVSGDRAARAAAGWGNDRLLRFFDGGDRGWVWALRWDDAANASEFVDTFRAYLDARGERVDGGWVAGGGTHWRVVRTADRTVAVVAGAERFVDAVAVDGGEEPTVTIHSNASATGFGATPVPSATRQRP